MAGLHRKHALCERNNLTALANRSVSLKKEKKNIHLFFPTYFLFQHTKEKSDMGLEEYSFICWEINSNG